MAPTIRALSDHLIYAGAGKVAFLPWCPRIGESATHDCTSAGLVTKSGLTGGFPPFYQAWSTNKRERSAETWRLFFVGHILPSTRDDQVVRRFNGASVTSPLGLFHVKSPPGGWGGGGLYAGRDISKPLGEACVRHSSSLDEATSISNFFFSSFLASSRPGARSVASVLRFPWVALERLADRADLSSLRNLLAATLAGAHFIGPSNS